jgi:hypothetical protein
MGRGFVRVARISCGNAHVDTLAPRPTEQRTGIICPSFPCFTHGLNCCGTHQNAAQRPDRANDVGRLPWRQTECRMHGGARGSGGPCGDLNGNYRHSRLKRTRHKDSADPTAHFGVEGIGQNAAGELATVSPLPSGKSPVRERWVQGDRPSFKRLLLGLSPRAAVV